MLLSGAIQSRIFDSWSICEEKCRQAENDGRCHCKSNTRASHAACLRGATLQARCQLAGAGSRGRFECEHRFKQRFQAMRDMRCFELFDWKCI